MKRFILVVSLHSVLISLNGQDLSQSEINIPNSPALHIVGIQTAEISSPGNYAGLYSSLISPIVSNNGVIPTNLSFEFSPAYLKSNNYSYNEIKRMDLYRDLKISIASNQVVLPGTDPFSRLGIGIKTKILNGNINKSLDAYSHYLEDIGHVGRILSLFTFSVEDNEEVDPEVLDSNISEIENEIIKEQIFKVTGKNKDNSNKIIKELKSIISEMERIEKQEKSKSNWNYELRRGSFLDVVSAFSLDFPENTLGYSQLNRWGIWLNYTYLSPKADNPMEFGSLLRVSNYSFDPTVVFENRALFADLGISGKWSIPDSKLMISGEYIGKLGFTDLQSSDEGNTFTFTSAKESKWNATIGYKISSDVIWNISLSEISTNRDYILNNSLQFLMGLSATIGSLNK